MQAAGQRFVRLDAVPAQREKPLAIPTILTTHNYAPCSQHGAQALETAWTTMSQGAVELHMQRMNPKSQDGEAGCRYTSRILLVITANALRTALFHAPSFLSVHVTPLAKVQKRD